eukprot:4644848-Alexandrium_andersonii.AAC.1
MHPSGGLGDYLFAVVSGASWFKFRTPHTIVVLFKGPFGQRPAESIRPNRFAAQFDGYSLHASSSTS